MCSVLSVCSYQAAEREMLSMCDGDEALTAEKVSW